MSETRFEVSQGFAVLRPRGGDAYTIPCDEWNLLKTRLRRLTPTTWIYENVGALLIGTSVATLVQLLLGTYDDPSLYKQRVISWSIVAVCALCGFAAWFFGHQHQRHQTNTASEIAAQMELIESRFEGTHNASSEHATKI